MRSILAFLVVVLLPAALAGLMGWLMVEHRSAIFWGAGLTLPATLAASILVQANLNRSTMRLLGCFVFGIMLRFSTLIFVLLLIRSRAPQDLVPALITAAACLVANSLAEAGWAMRTLGRKRGQEAERHA